MTKTPEHPGLSTRVYGIIGSCSGSVYSAMSRSFWMIRPGSDRKVPWVRVGRRDLGVVGGQLHVLVVFFGAVVAAGEGEGEDHWVAALQFAELADGAGVVGQRVVGEGAAGDDVRMHGMTAFHVVSRIWALARGARL
jgi:hypothetical protein